MDKAKLFAALRDFLANELAVVKASADAAREGATHEQAKPENQYDTRALEQSYLAGAQTARAEALAGSLAALEMFRAPAFGEDDPVRTGAAVVVEDDDGAAQRYLLCDMGGGTKLNVDGQRWTVLTPSAPLGRALIGRRVGDVVERTVRGRTTTLEITGLY